MLHSCGHLRCTFHAGKFRHIICQCLGLWRVHICGLVCLVPGIVHLLLGHRHLVGVVALHDKRTLCQEHLSIIFKVVPQGHHLRDHGRPIVTAQRRLFFLQR